VSFGRDTGKAEGCGDYLRAFLSRVPRRKYTTSAIFTVFPVLFSSLRDGWFFFLLGQKLSAFHCVQMEKLRVLGHDKGIDDSRPFCLYLRFFFPELSPAFKTFRLFPFNFSSPLPWRKRPSFFPFPGPEDIFLSPFFPLFSGTELISLCSFPLPPPPPTPSGGSTFPFSFFFLGFCSSPGGRDQPPPFFFSPFGR